MRKIAKAIENAGYKCRVISDIKLIACEGNEKEETTLTKVKHGYLVEDDKESFIIEGNEDDVIEELIL